MTTIQPDISKTTGLAMASWALRQSPQLSSEFIEQASSEVTIRLIGKMKSGKTGEITMRFSLQDARRLLSDDYPLDAIQERLIQTWDFGDLPIVQISVD